MANESVTERRTEQVPVITRSADLPQNYIFLGINFEPYAVMFRHREGGFRPIVLASFEVALEQPIDVLAPGKDEEGQRDRLEHIKWHKKSRDEEDQA